MSRELDRTRSQRVPVAREVIDLRPTDMPQSPPAGFISFRYSRTEISSQGREVHVRMAHTRYQNGKLTSEECEGTMDRDAYRQAVQDRQVEFVGEVFGLARALLAPLFARTTRSARPDQSRD